jgi:hypothetical protein
VRLPFFHRQIRDFYSPGGPTAGVTGKRGDLAARKLPDAESAIGAADPKVRATPRTCPVHAVLGRSCAVTLFYADIEPGGQGKLT